MIKHFSSAVVISLCLAGPSWSQDVVPDAALAEEMAGHWEQALAIYRLALAADARRADLWVRVADIATRLGRSADAIDALVGATRAAPLDPALHSRLSQAYAGAQQPALALTSVERALQLRPEDVEYSESAAVLSMWNGDYGRARTHYERIRELSPGKLNTLRALGRVRAWMGDTDAAADALHEFIRGAPGEPGAWMELAQVESWRGNQAQALAVLDGYLERFGDTPERRLALARVLTAAGRPSRASELLSPLIAQNPESYELNLAQALASAVGNHVAAARRALASATRIDGTNPETRKAERLIRTVLGSTVEPTAWFSSDSDHLQTFRLGARASIALPVGTRLSAGYEHQELRAPIRSGLGRGDGQAAIREAGWMGLAQSAGAVTLTGRLGTSSADGHDHTEYLVGLRVRHDAIVLEAEQSRAAFALSPRTITDDLTIVRHNVRADWNPAVNLHVVADAVFEQISDGNTRWDVTIAPRYAVARRASLNLDLGVSAHRLQASRDLPNGYYDPRLYESYAVVAYPYWKLCENVGLGASLELGAQRERAKPFTLGGDATVTAHVGIYREWALNLGAGITNNRRVDSGAYRGINGSMVLIRRF